MFDISWTEFLLIGVVALIFIGPKELPAVMRTVGQWTRRVRGMAAEFQNQFQEAMREAEMADLKKQVDDMAHGIKSYDPLKEVRSDLEAAGKEVAASLQQPPSAAGESAAPETAAADSGAAPVADLPPSAATAESGEKDIIGATVGAVVPESSEPATVEAASAPAELRENDFVGAAGTGPAAPDTEKETAPPDSTGHTA